MYVTISRNFSNFHTELFHAVSEIVFHAQELEMESIYSFSLPMEKPENVVCPAAFYTFYRLFQ